MILRQEQHKDNGSKTFVLKVDMHCQCNGCVKKINDGVKEINLSEGTCPSLKSASLCIVSWFAIVYVFCCTALMSDLNLGLHVTL